MKKISEPLEQMPRTISTAVTTPQAFQKARHEKGVEYYEEVSYTPEGDMIFKGKIQREKISISRATCNFSGAYPYLFDVISYVCFHARGALLETDNYYSITLPYNFFLDFALDNCKGQLQYLQNELYRFDKARQSKIIAVNENTSIYAQPVILLYSAGKRPLSEKGKRGAAQLKKQTHVKVEILFLKCLVHDIIQNNNKYLDLPKAFFAKLKNVEKIFEHKLVYREPDTGFSRLVDKKGLKKQGSGLDLSDAKPLISIVPAEVIYKALNYIRLHDNSISPKIMLRGIDLLKHCTPQFIKTRSDKQGNTYDGYQNADEAKSFLQLLVFAVNEVCRAGVLNAMPTATMLNLITKVESAGDEDIFVYYGNRKNKRVAQNDIFY
jgi:hypothetical protein